MPRTYTAEAQSEHSSRQTAVTAVQRKEKYVTIFKEYCTFVMMLIIWQIASYSEEFAKTSGIFFCIFSFSGLLSLRHKSVISCKGLSASLNGFLKEKDNNEHIKEQCSVCGYSSYRSRVFQKEVKTVYCTVFNKH